MQTLETLKIMRKYNREKSKEKKKYKRELKAFL